MFPNFLVISLTTAKPLGRAFSSSAVSHSPAAPFRHDIRSRSTASIFLVAQRPIRKARKKAKTKIETAIDQGSRVTGRTLPSANPQIAERTAMPRNATSRNRRVLLCDSSAAFLPGSPNTCAIIVRVGQDRLENYSRRHFAMHSADGEDIDQR